MEDDPTFIKKYEMLIIGCLGFIGVIFGLWYDPTFIEKYDTLIVGGFGFLGVIWTLKSNARLAREQHKWEIRQQRKAVRVALLQELRINKDAVARGADHQADAEKPMDVLVPTDVIDFTYRSFIDRIGLLTEAEIYMVTHAYLVLKEAKSKLVLLGIPSRLEP